MMQKSSLSNFCLTNVRNLKVFLEVHGRDIDFAKSEQSYHLTTRMQRQLQLDCFCHFTGRDIYQSHTPLYAYMLNGIKPIFNQVFDPMTLTCSFCFWRMVRIQVWLSESSYLTLILATHTKKIKYFDGKRGGSHEMLISDVCHNYQF